MIYEKLKTDSASALKNGNKERRLVLNDIIATIDKATIQKGTRLEITDSLAEDVLIKYQKTIQESLDACPLTAQYADRRSEIEKKLNVVKEYAPQTITDPKEIEARILYWALQDVHNVPTDNKGKFIKFFMSECKSARMDMKTANAVLNKLWENYVNGES